MKNYIDTHLRWQQRKIHPLLKLLLVVHLPILFLIFFILIPGWSARQYFDFPMGLTPPMNFIIGVPLVAFGLVLYLWTIVLFAKARGTQVPMAPTQMLVTTGPYAITRNPMMTSGSLMVCGMSLILNSWSFAMTGLIPFALYLVYIRFVEEKELEARFGGFYLSYKKDTPFFLPKLFSSKSKNRSYEPVDN